MPGCISIISLLLLSAVFSFSAVSTAWAEGRLAAWGQARQPSAAQSAQSIGFYSAGCIAGAQALPLSGPGFQVMRLDRNRYYGHPSLIQFIQELGFTAQQHDVRLLIGDLSQPRGGPMSYGHRSHQIGLDADIWLQHLASDQALSPKQVLTLPMRSVVDKKRGRLIAERWSPVYTELLRATARSPEVERVFVNPVIKQALCRNPANHVWLSKIRPWWGHDAHFHVRLTCPPDSPQCRPQEPPAADSGCDKYLDQWVQEQMSPPKKKRSSPAQKKKPLVLPTACNAVLDTH